MPDNTRRMVLKPDQERVKTLLQDTITLLCRNGLNFKSEFNINALIGITLDKDDVFLVDIRETIKNSRDGESEEDGTNEEEAALMKRRAKKRPRKRSHSASGSDSDAGPPSKASDNSRAKIETPEDDDSEGDAIIIKDEPAFDTSNSNQNDSDILGNLAQQGQLYGTPTSDSAWDGTGQALYTQGVSLPSQPGNAANASMSSAQQQQRWEQMRSLQDLPPQARRIIPGKDYKYQCKECQRKFYSLTGLSDHVKAAHRGIFRYTCPHCQKGFSGSTHLGAHIRRLHTPEGFKCPICLELFTYITGLKMHLKKEHDEDLYHPKYGYKTGGSMGYGIEITDVRGDVNGSEGLTHLDYSDNEDELTPDDENSNSSIPGQPKTTLSENTKMLVKIAVAKKKTTRPPQIGKPIINKPSPPPAPVAAPPQKKKKDVAMPTLSTDGASTLQTLVYIPEQNAYILRPQTSTQSSAAALPAGHKSLFNATEMNETGSIQAVHADDIADEISDITTIQPIKEEEAEGIEQMAGYVYFEVESPKDEDDQSAAEGDEKEKKDSGQPGAAPMELVGTVVKTEEASGMNTRHKAKTAAESGT